jgi:tryptophan halogenase
MLGQGIEPAGFDPMVESVPAKEAAQTMSRMRSMIAQTAHAMPTHQQFIDRHCRADGAQIGQPPAKVSA